MRAARNRGLVSVRRHVQTDGGGQPSARPPISASSYARSQQAVEKVDHFVYSVPAALALPSMNAEAVCPLELATWRR